MLEKNVFESQINAKIPIMSGFSNAATRNTLLLENSSAKRLPVNHKSSLPEGKIRDQEFIKEVAVFEKEAFQPMFENETFVDSVKKKKTNLSCLLCRLKRL